MIKGLGIDIVEISSISRSIDDDEMYKLIKYISSKGIKVINEMKILNKMKINLKKVWFDPGIGFGKTLNQNLQLMKSLKKFSSANIQVLLGSSRKSWINYIDPSNADERIGGSLASVAHALEQNIHTYRIHDVKEKNQMIKVLKALNK